MKHPPYHLRPNKAVDRLMFIEAIRRLGMPNDLAKYEYYGFGGPYLEEFRLLYEFFPEVKMTSLEDDQQTFKRQKFHLPCGSITLLYRDFKSFLTQYDSHDRKSIFWLDYIDLKYGCFEDFMALLCKVADRSVIKITLRAAPNDYLETKKIVEFNKQFSEVMPNSSMDPPREFDKFVRLLQDMLQISSQKTLSNATGRVFQPISSFFYNDGTGMFTLTGIVCPRDKLKDIRPLFKDWCFANLNWNKPRIIDMPFLSTKERLHLQKHLPCGHDAGRKLLKKLGYIIDENRRKTIIKMKQYADFYRYYPHFVRAIP